MSGTIQTPPTSAMTVTSGATGVFPVSYGYYPVEGSRGVTAQYTWAGVTGYNEDLSVLSAMGVETTPQAAYVDNSTVTTAVTLTVKGTGQVVTVPAGSQGIFPLFFTATPGLFISTTGTGSGVTRVTYLNVPTNAAGVWSTTGSSGSYTGPPAASQGGTTAGTQGGLSLVGVNLGTPAVSDGQMAPLSLTTSGILRIVPLTSSGTAITASTGAATAPGAGLATLGLFNNTPPTLTSGQSVGLQLDSRGGLIVNGASNLQTYATSAFITPAAAATDVFAITGSITKSLLITEVTLSLSASAAGVIPISLVRRTSTNTGGTSTSGTNVAHNSNNAATTATTAAYTANPTGLGTLGGAVEAFLALAPASDVRVYTFYFGAQQGNQPVAVGNNTQSFCVNLGGGTMPAGLQIAVLIRWMEV